ncbi:MAG: hypothetical protein AB1679_09125 [Actinomycetota bacterium]|jgi:hypothetical protein
MEPDTIVVELVVAVEPNAMSLREDAWSMAMDQRVFGPGRVLVGAADRTGALLGIAYTRTTDPLDLALACCLEHLFNSAVVPQAAIVFNDEPVRMAPPPPDLGPRFEALRQTAAAFGVHLVDWFGCDGDSELIRSTRIAVGMDGEWWDVP